MNKMYFHAEDIILQAYPTPKIELHEAPFTGDFTFSAPTTLLPHTVYAPIDITHSPSSSNSACLSPQSSPSAFPLSPPSSTSTLSETLAKASNLPEAFFPEFHQYSKEIYEQSTGCGRKRKRGTGSEQLKDVKEVKGEEEEQKFKVAEDFDSWSDGEDEGNSRGLSTTELRRQIHIQSEQKRRAQIKDGFDDLRKQLPGCLNKKMSKAALLNRTVQHIQHLKSTQTTLMNELQRLAAENDQLRKYLYQDSLQKQALYSITAM